MFKSNIFKNIIGWSGALLFLLTYFLTAKEIILPTQISFHILNLFGALLLAIRVYLDKNYSNLFLEICFIIIAIYYIIKYTIL
jgi:hypothetical protein